MSKVELPQAIACYFSAKEQSDTEKTLSCFAEDATVWDNGEDLELNGIAQIQQWLTSTVSSYELTYQVISLAKRR